MHNVIETFMELQALVFVLVEERRILEVRLSSLPAQKIIGFEVI
jgi:hypothetical protein